MANNRMISTRFWEDNYIFDLSPDHKLIFLYLLTNSQTTMAGVYELNLHKASMETGIEYSALTKIIDRFTTDGKVYYLEGHVILRNFMRHQKPNPSVKQGIMRELNNLPERLRKLFAVNDDGLYFDARELAGKEGGSIELLTTEIDRLWIKMEEERKRANDDKRSTFTRGAPMK